MKNILLMGGAAVAAYFLFFKNKKEDDGSGNVTPLPKPVITKGIVKGNGTQQSSPRPVAPAIWPPKTIINKPTVGTRPLPATSIAGLPTVW